MALVAKLDSRHPVLRSPISLIPDKSKLSCQFVREYETDSLPKCLNYDVENKRNAPSVSSFKLVQVAGSEIEMKNFTNPGLG